MRIGFDVSPLVRPHPPGVVRATRGLVECLEARGRVEIVRLAPPAGMRSAPWRQFVLPREAGRASLAGLHSPVSAFAVAGRGFRSCTIHEVPWAADERENADARHRLWCALGPLRADAIVCPSRRTCAHVAEASPLATSRIHHVPWGVDARFARRADAADADDVLVAARAGLVPGAYVLAVGATRAKKNAVAALRALRCADSDLVLALTGPVTPEILAAAATTDVGSRVRLLGVPADDDLAALVRGAAASVLLSRSEGFGFPVLEAQAAGTPVVVPRDGAQHEIGGEAVIAVDAEDPRELARAFRRARDERRAWAELGRANAARYTWDAAARRIESVWEALA